MDQFSLHGFDEQLERRLKELASKEGVSLKDAALMLLKRGAGLAGSEQPSTPIGNRLDRFIGRWSQADEESFLESIAACEAVDESLWK